MFTTNFAAEVGRKTAWILEDAADLSFEVRKPAERRK